MNNHGVNNLHAQRTTYGLGLCTKSVLYHAIVQRGESCDTHGRESWRLGKSQRNVEYTPTSEKYVFLVKIGEMVGKVTSKFQDFMLVPAMSRGWCVIQKEYL